MNKLIKMAHEFFVFEIGAKSSLPTHSEDEKGITCE